LGLKWLAPLSIAEMKNEWSCTPTATMYLQDIDMDNFTFTFYLAHFSQVVGGD